jgi:hypothetical protein
LRSESRRGDERASEGGSDEVARGGGSVWKVPAKYGTGGVRTRLILARWTGQPVWTRSSEEVTLFWLWLTSTAPGDWRALESTQVMPILPLGTSQQLETRSPSSTPLSSDLALVSISQLHSLLPRHA